MIAAATTGTRRSDTTPVRRTTDLNRDESSDSVSCTCSGCSSIDTVRETLSTPDSIARSTELRASADPSGSSVNSAPAELSLITAGSSVAATGLASGVSAELRSSSPSAFASSLEVPTESESSRRTVTVSIATGVCGVGGAESATASPAASKEPSGASVEKRSSRDFVVNGTSHSFFSALSLTQYELTDDSPAKQNPLDFSRALHAFVFLGPATQLREFSNMITRTGVISMSRSFRTIRSAPRASMASKSSEAISCLRISRSIVMHGTL
mmetsp:Transcript_6515/g.17437  ORF Transcript_6515/g.17437 Transcript_6515/m.17437 type:complete len:269 (-) Transcript_6515:754-1560(-)